MGKDASGGEEGETVTDYVLGVDASFHELTRQQAEDLALAGVAVWVQCLWTGAVTPKPAQSNLDIAAATGLITAGYGSLCQGAQDGLYHAERTVTAVRSSTWDSLRFVATDVELDGIANTAIREMVDALYVFGKRRVIYTSFGCWVYKQRNPQDFTDCLLWNANWDAEPDVDFPTLRFGGWKLEQVLGEQWSGGYTFPCGAYTDRNTFRVDLLKEEPMPNFVVYTEAQRTEILKVSLRMRETDGGVAPGKWQVVWLNFFKGYNVPEAARIIPPIPAIAYGDLQTAHAVLPDGTAVF
jgi:hypothetical protein